MRIVGANGIRSHGAGNIDLLLLEMRVRGFDTRDVRLPKRHILSSRWGGESDGKLIAEQSSDGDIVVAHSFGCLRSWYAHWHRNYRAIICIAPAMAMDTEWRYPERIHCFYSPDDWAIKLGSWLLFHPFGRAGNKGFKQKLIQNNKQPRLDHNDFFYGQNLQRICDYIADLA